MFCFSKIEIQYRVNKYLALSILKNEINCNFITSFIYQTKTNCLKNARKYTSIICIYPSQKPMIYQFNMKSTLFEFIFCIKKLHAHLSKLKLN